MPTTPSNAVNLPNISQTSRKRKASDSVDREGKIQNESECDQIPVDEIHKSDVGRYAAKNGPKKSKPARLIPRCFEECSEADKQLITMRDANMEWKVIRAAWTELTGEKTGSSTLPNRYARLKSNFTAIREEDIGRLLEAKHAVDEAFQREKWESIALKVRERGGDVYTGELLQRQYKKIMVGAGAVPPPGISDPDFDGIESIESDDSE